MSKLPGHVTLREVALRDGLQIEDPIPLSAKIELLEAVAATGVREVEATAFVSPSKVPAPSTDTTGPGHVGSVNSASAAAPAGQRFPFTAYSACVYVKHAVRPHPAPPAIGSIAVSARNAQRAMGILRREGWVARIEAR